MNPARRRRLKTNPLSRSPTNPTPPRTSPLNRETKSNSMHTVHVRVNDAATKQPTPVRIHFRDADDNYFAPFGRLAEFSTDTGVDVGGNVYYSYRKYAYIDGACEINLPSGPVTV